MIVKFPEYMPTCGRSNDTDISKQWHRYYYIHYMYIKNILISAGISILDVDPIKFFNYKFLTAFEIFINKDRILFDYSDHINLSILETDISKYKAIFKFHYTPELIKYKNIYPFTPVNFHDWKLFYKIKDSLQYKATGLILNNQVPTGAAVERRNFVREMLTKQYNNKLDYSITSYNEFYEKVNNCLVSVCVPGARNNMLDRGQSQYMFLGACTISPNLITVLSYNKVLVPGVHYVECNPDYSDLIDKIEWVNNNKEEAIKIGNNAKQLLLSTSLPIKQIEWIKKCVYNE
jgi:hypothetical protein